jgi:hypothetical protein
VDTLWIRRFKISKNNLKRKGGATGSTTFQNEVKNVTPKKTRTRRSFDGYAKKVT